MMRPHTEEERRQRVLQQNVLAYLQQHGPGSWHALYSRFNLTSDVSVASVLQELKDCGYIEVTKHENVMVAAITKSGLTRLR
jgi:hypothetical protein